MFIFRSYCYSVDFSRVKGPEKTTYKAVDSVFGSFKNDWITLIGTFNFGTLDRLNVGGGPKALFSIRDVCIYLLFIYFFTYFDNKQY